MPLFGNDLLARFLEVQKEFGTFDAYIWRFVGGHPNKTV